MQALLNDLVSAVWMQSISLAAVASLLLILYVFDSIRALRRERRRTRQLAERALVLAQLVRRLSYKASLGGAPSAHEYERRSLMQALHALPLEQFPDPHMVRPVVMLLICLQQMENALASPNRGEAEGQLAQLHRQADKAATDIRALIRLHFDRPRLPLRRRSVAGMPTTAVDRYATFVMVEEYYLEEGGIDFEVLVNNQGVLCTVSHTVLDRLAALRNLPVHDDFRRHEAIFRQQREHIYDAARALICAGARSPVEITIDAVVTCQEHGSAEQAALKLAG